MSAEISRLKTAVEFAKKTGELRRDDKAQELWNEVYGELSEGRAGMLGAMLGRSEAQTMRLAMLYALLDCSNEIRVEHLNAALALWNYCESSAAYLFGDSMGDPVADAILGALRSRGPEGIQFSAGVTGDDSALVGVPLAGA